MSPCTMNSRAFGIASVAIATYMFISLGLGELFYSNAVAHAKERSGSMTPSVNLLEPYSYVIAVKRSTYSDSGWKTVVDELRYKHKGKVLFHRSRLEEIMEELKRIQPWYLCLVLRSHDAIRDAIIKIHRMTRVLDDDPYGDVIWGIVTGYTAEDALRMCTLKRLEIRRGLGKTQVLWLKYLESGAYYSEAVKNHKYTKAPEQGLVKVDGPDDTTAEIVTAINSGKVDIMWTSGHASERDWQLGWAFPDGVFFSHNGHLKASDLKGKSYDVRAPHPMIYYAPGNCLIGHIKDPRNCMALSWIRAGACQFGGYTRKSWYGYMGWGVGDYFFLLKDSFTFAESVFLSNQALLFDLKNKIPGIKEQGHLYDRDVFVLYGDPALDSRIVGTAEPPLYHQDLKFDQLSQNRYKVFFSIRMAKRGKVACPAAAFFPKKVLSIGELRTNSYKVDVSDRFILMKLIEPPGVELEQDDLFYTSFIAMTSTYEEPISTKEPPPFGPSEVLRTIKENVPPGFNSKRGHPPGPARFSCY